MLDVQIGRVLLKGRFVITNQLSSSPLLLGTDFLTKNKVWISPYSNGKWFCCIGPSDKPLGKIEALQYTRLILAGSAFTYTYNIK